MTVKYVWLLVGDEEQYDCRGIMGSPGKWFQTEDVNKAKSRQRHEDHFHVQRACIYPANSRKKP